MSRRPDYDQTHPLGCAGVDVGLPSPPTAATNHERVVFHLDMDCFFVTVVCRNRPELKGKPVAVCHAGSVVNNIHENHMKEYYQY